MFRKILFPTDFSATAKAAQKYIEKLQEAGTEEVVILTVIHELGINSILDGCQWAGISPEQCRKEVLEDVQKKEKLKAEKIKNRFAEIGIKGKIIIEFGHPAEKILEIAEQDDFSLIVMGAHGAGMVKELLMGSVTERVS